MFEQYFRVKERYPGCLLFFRMGDFYELFFDDAKECADTLDIQLTQRGRHAGEDVPMCGVPVRAVEAYLARLIRRGYRVAICEQTETPQAARQRGGGLVRREVVRLVTRGTLSEEALLEAAHHNYLMSVSRRRGVTAVAWAEISTGEMNLRALDDVGWEALRSELARLAPAEILVPSWLMPENVRPDGDNDGDGAADGRRPINDDGDGDNEGDADSRLNDSDDDDDNEGAVDGRPDRDDDDEGDGDGQSPVNDDNESAASLSSSSSDSRPDNIDDDDDDGGGSGGRELLRLPAEIYSEWRDAITEVSAVADDDEAKSVLAEMTRKLVASRAKKTGEDDKPGENEKTAGTGENGWLRLTGKIDKWHAAERHALAELLLYIEHTQVSRLPRLSPPRRDASARTLQMDAATRANLELTRKRDGARAGSLLATMDRTESGAGARLLASWLAAPLADAEKINERLDGVEFLARNPDLRRRVVNKLGKLPETERAMARLSLGRGGPRDLAAARDGLELAARIAAVLDDPAFRDGDLPKILEETDAELARTVIGTPVPELRRTLKNALASPLPSAAQNGGYIRADYDHRLKKLRDAENESRRKIAALQEKYIRSTGVPSLRIRHNRVLGYYIEVGRSFAAKLPQTRDSPFSLRQSIANAVRYTTEELREMQDNLASASARSIALEESIFIGLCDAVHEQADHILTALRAAARIDVLCALAAHAAEREWTRPILADEPVFNVKAGRHPVVEAALAESGADFVANDCVLGGKAPRLTLLTGPNMAGKSTYLRQNALILILAQTGSFVPAESLTLGVADRLFSRIGAADDLARGHSTFMVEMLETAQILRGANENSFVILDELGRGTSTHDGLALAWAASEHLHAVNRCRTLFATHYHELAPLYEELPDALTMQMRVREWRGEIVFLHEAAPGAAHASYGLHVARLAGVPEPIVSRAAVILAGFEGTAHRPDARTEPPPPLPRSLRTMHPVLKALTKVKPDNLAPKEALEILYQLRNQLREMEKKK